MSEIAKTSNLKHLPSQHIGFVMNPTRNCRDSAVSWAMQRQLGIYDSPKKNWAEDLALV
jgi:hypothetical protein